MFRAGQRGEAAAGWRVLSVALAALMVTVVGLAATWLAVPLFGGVRVFVPVALIAGFALVAGTWPAVASAVLTAVALRLLFPPLWSLGVDDPRQVYLTVGFLGLALLVSAVGGAQHRARRRLAAQAARATRQAEELRRSERQYRALAESSPEVIARFDPELRHTYVNAYGARVYGIPSDRVIGKTNAELGMPADKVAFWNAAFEEVFASGRQRTVDFEFDSPILGRRQFSSLFVPEIDESGRVASIVTITRDVSAERRAAEAVRVSEEKFRSVFERAAIGMGRVRFGDARWMDVNDAFCRMLGYSREEMLSIPWPDMTHPEDLALDLIPFRRMAAGELECYTIEKRFVRRDGRYVWARLTLSLVRDGLGRPDFEIAVIEDIGDRKRAEEALRESEARYRALFEHTAMASVVGRVIFEGDRPVDFVHEQVNSVFEQQTGVRVADVVGRRMSEVPALLKDDAAGLIRMFGEVARTERPLRYEHYMPSLGRWFEGTVYCPNPGHFACLFLDVTERKVAQESLRAANERLLDADRRKNEFLAMLSHELRNPLAPIKNSLYVLDRATPGGQQARRAHEIIGRQVLHMTRLIDDLLDVTRITRGKIRLQRERVELCGLLQRTAEDHRSIFVEGEIAIEVGSCPAPVYVSGDPTRLAQVIGNLLSNAAKFTPRGGRVELGLRSEEGTAVILVRDNGAGVSPALRDKLFEPFVQADVTLDRSQGGLGLGLALVKGLVELHGGRVVLNSSGTGAGAEFVVELPLEKSDAQPRPTDAVPAATPPARALNILVIEDNTDAAESLKEALQIIGHEVVVASTGVEGLEKARAHHPDVVLCDIGLPGIDGFEVARLMRSDPALRSAPLVALSGYAAPEDLERSREAGFVRHLAKPPDLDQLESTLLETCGAPSSAA